MEKFKITALINLKPVTVISDCTEDGTQLVDFYENEEQDFRTAIRRGHIVRIGRGSGVEELASYDSPMGVAAALYSVCPSNTIFLSAPDSIRVRLGNQIGKLILGEKHKDV